MGLSSKTISFFFGLITGSVVYLSAVKLYKLLRENSKKAEDEDELPESECLFFTPNGTQCKNDVNKVNTTICNSVACNLCNYMRFTRYLSQTKRQLDICVYLITIEEICSIIVNLFRNGVFVRIITDKQMSEEASGAKVLVFRREYIPLKVVDTSQLMHNKFVIIDNSIVITGSFNWTKQGMNGNYENAIFTYDRAIVKKYSEYFQMFWDGKI